MMTAATVWSNSLTSLQLTKKGEGKKEKKKTGSMALNYTARTGGSVHAQVREGQGT